MVDLLYFTLCGDSGMFQLFINTIIFPSQWLQFKQEEKKKIKISITLSSNVFSSSL